MNPSDEKLNPEEELRANNEIEQLKLDLEFGGTSFISDDAPPELIAMFLKNVRAYEENYSNVPSISVKEYLGNPNYPGMDEVDRESIPVLIDIIETLLKEKHILIERPKFLSDKGWYHFLIDDILNHQFTPPLQGMTQYFDYSDFRQDGPEYIGIVTQEMVESIINLKEEFDPSLLAEVCRNHKDQINKQEAIGSILNFRNTYKEIIPIAFSNLEQKANESALFQIFGINYKGIDQNDIEHNFDGIGICQLTVNMQTRTWQVEGMEFPGFGF